MKLVFRQHAIRRMFERGVTVEDIAAVLTSGVAIETYPDDSPYPSTLWLGYVGARPLHVVCAENSSENERIIVTVYNPIPRCGKQVSRKGNHHEMPDLQAWRNQSGHCQHHARTAECDAGFSQRAGAHLRKLRRGFS